MSNHLNALDWSEDYEITCFKQGKPLHSGLERLKDVMLEDHATDNPFDIEESDVDENPENVIDADDETIDVDVDV